jgi:hypothetical protein
MRYFRTSVLQNLRRVAYVSDEKILAYKIRHQKYILTKLQTCFLLRKIMEFSKTKKLY